MSYNLKCPACGSKLGKIKLSNTVVDVCQGGCAGIWFDNGELQKFDEISEADGKILINLKKNPNINLSDKSKIRKCPICDVVMEKTIIHSDKDIEIDKCSKCNGVWLDAGELADIRKETVQDDEKTQRSMKLFNDLRSKFR